MDDHLVVWAGMWAALDAAEETSGGDALRLVEQGLDNAAIAERLEVVTRIDPLWGGADPVPARL